MPVEHPASCSSPSASSTATRPSTSRPRRRTAAATPTGRRSPRTRLLRVPVYESTAVDDATGAERAGRSQVHARRRRAPGRARPRRAGPRHLPRREPAGDDRRPRLFGGQVAAQAARATSLTVPEDRSVHSLHGYFLRAGRADRPTILHVDRDRDGGSFSARHVAARQDGEVIISLLVSFHVDEEGPEFQAVGLPPGVPAPEDVAPPAGWFPHQSVLDLRITGTGRPRGKWADLRTSSGPAPAVRSPTTACCTRACSPISPTSAPGSRSSCSRSRRGSEPDHAVWFHHPGRMDDWVLVDLVPGAQPAPAASTPAPSTTATADCSRPSPRST